MKIQKKKAKHIYKLRGSTDLKREEEKERQQEQIIELLRKDR